jgi:hypothetical protein
MTRDCYKPLVWLMWLALPATALDYWLAWDRLPARMAVHFDANWQPNGYTSHQGALELGLGIMAFVLIISTVVTLVAQALKPSAASWALLAIFYTTLFVCWYANHSIIKFNLHAAPVHSGGMDPGSLAMKDSCRQAAVQPQL